jgi:hypothetical protein
MQDVHGPVGLDVPVSDRPPMGGACRLSEPVGVLSLPVYRPRAFATAQGRSAGPPGSASEHRWAPRSSTARRTHGVPRHGERVTGNS